MCGRDPTGLGAGGIASGSSIRATSRSRRPCRSVDQGVARTDPAPGRLVAPERLRPRQDPTQEPPPALPVAYRTGGHVPDLARHAPPFPGTTGPVEPARGGRRRRPAAVGPRPPAAGRRVLRRPGDGHRRRRVRQDPDDGGAGGLRRPPPRQAARRDRLHHLHEQGHRGDPATDARTPAGPPGGHDPPARAPGAEARRRPHRPALADGGGRRTAPAADRRLDPRGDRPRPEARRRRRTAPERAHGRGERRRTG